MNHRFVVSRKTGRRACCCVGSPQPHNGVNASGGHLRKKTIERSRNEKERMSVQRSLITHQYFDKNRYGNAHVLDTETGTIRRGKETHALSREQESSELFVSSYQFEFVVICECRTPSCDRAQARPPTCMTTTETRHSERCIFRCCTADDRLERRCVSNRKTIKS